MRITAIVLLMLAAGVQLSVAQTPTLCIYSDDAGTQCSFDDVVGLNSFYIFLIDAPGATGVEFSAPRPVCMTGSSWLADEHVWGVTVGTSQDGVSVGFGSCTTGPVHVLTVHYQSTGIVEQDCAYPIEPIIGQPTPRYVDCQNDFQTAGTGSAYINSALGCDCELLEPVPVLEVTPASLRYEPDETVKTLSISNIGPGVLNWSISTIADFMSFDPPSGTGDATVVVTIDRAGINTETLKTLTVSSNGGSATIQVTVKVDGGGIIDPVLGVNPTSLSFAALEIVQALQIRNTGGGVLNWLVASTPPWLEVLPTTGTNGADATVIVDRTGLSAGTYNGNIEITSNGGDVTVPVSMEVVTNPILYVEPLSLNFPAATTFSGITLRNNGVGSLDWTVTPDQPWLSVSQTTGSLGSGFTFGVTVYVDRTSLTDGTYYGNLQITSNGGNASVAVSMEVLTTPVLTVAPTSLSFPFNVGEKTLSVTNDGFGILNWSIVPDEPWVSVLPAAGANTTGVSTNVTVTIDRSTLADGNHMAALNVTSDGGNTIVPISVDVLTSPVLSVIPTGITLNQNNPIKNFQISNVGAAALEWSISENEDWLSVSPASGTDYAIIQVIADLDLAPEGPADTQVFVTSNGGDETVDIYWRPIVGGNAGSIGVFEDNRGLDPCIDDGVVGLKQVYVVHFNVVGATASQFAAPMPSCWTGAAYLSDTAVYPIAIGNSQTGVAIGYGTCLTAPIMVLTINYFVQGLMGQTCCPYSVIPDPHAASGQIEVANCLNEVIYGSGFTSYVSAPPCNCSVSVRAEETTWGQIKAMYLDDAEVQRLQDRP